MATQLGLYNGALRHLGETPLASVSESRASRRVLSSIYSDGFVKAVLEAGQWNFATRSSELTYEPSVTPSFGYSKAFTVPSDYVRLAAISTDEKFNTPLMDYREEAGYWYCDHETIYVSYVSDDASFGGNLGAWPESFKRFAELYLAELAAPAINRDKLGDVVKLCRQAKMDALSKDAMADPVKFLPQGTWAGATLGNGGRFLRSRIGFER